MTTEVPFHYHTTSLGHNTVAQAQVPNAAASDSQYRKRQGGLKIMTASTTDEVYTPAESVDLNFGETEKLSNFIVQHFPPLLVSWELADLLHKANGKMVIEVTLDPDAVAGAQDNAVKQIINSLSQWGLNVTKTLQGDILYITGSLMDGYRSKE